MQGVGSSYPDRASPSSCSPTWGCHASSRSQRPEDRLSPSSNPPGHLWTGPGLFDRLPLGQRHLPAASQTQDGRVRQPGHVPHSRSLLLTQAQTKQLCLGPLDPRWPAASRGQKSAPLVRSDEGSLRPLSTQRPGPWPISKAALLGFLHLSPASLSSINHGSRSESRLSICAQGQIR